MAGSEVLVLIPARMAATRFPGKPLAEIEGVPMIVHVWRRAVAAAVGRVAVATDSAEIADAVAKAGGEAVMTTGPRVLTKLPVVLIPRVWSLRWSTCRATCRRSHRRRSARP